MTRAYLLATLSLVAVLAIGGGIVASMWWRKPNTAKELMLYGRVVDGSEKPIAGVYVSYELLQWESSSASGGRKEIIRRGRVTSDAAGNFCVAGTGHSLSITGFNKEWHDLNWAFPPPDPRIPPTTFTFDDLSHRANLPNTPSTRIVYPLNADP